MSAKHLCQRGAAAAWAEAVHDRLPPPLVCHCSALVQARPACAVCKPSITQQLTQPAHLYHERPLGVGFDGGADLQAATARRAHAPPLRRSDRALQQGRVIWQCGVRVGGLPAEAGRRLDQALLERRQGGGGGGRQRRQRHSWLPAPRVGPPPQCDRCPPGERPAAGSAVQALQRGQTGRGSRLRRTLQAARSLASMNNGSHLPASCILGVGRAPRGCERKCRWVERALRA